MPPSHGPQKPSSSTAAHSPTDTKLDKIMLVLSALCTKMGMPQIILGVQSTTDAPVERAAQPTTKDAADPELSNEPETLD
ncbi:UNVERIFIED_CONTAM: hypothetical protein Sangu_2750600 [Sesamum angustifolium]|uniref:Uncharacterized protein n=1 Tax=Sesamum angustifolium TaxID=2727405 RepID=A0AAW2IX96_9LAMI